MPWEWVSRSLMELWCWITGYDCYGSWLDGKIGVALLLFAFGLRLCCQQDILQRTRMVPSVGIGYDLAIPHTAS